MKRLVLFDFDGTLTERDSLFDFIRLSFPFLKKFTAGMIFIPRIALSFIGLKDKNQTKEQLLSFLLQSYSKSEIKALGKELIPEINLKFKTLKAFKNHIEKGDQVVIVSASPDIWIKPFAEKYQVEYLATNWDYSSNQFLGENCNNEEKAIRIKAAYNLDDYKEIIAYGNSNGDKAMMDLADVKNWV